MGKLSVWADEMLRLSPGTLDKVLSLGASVQRFVRGGNVVDGGASGKPVAPREDAGDRSDDDQRRPPIM